MFGYDYDASFDHDDYYSETVRKYPRDFDKVCQEKLKKMKILREKLNWEIEDEGHEFLCQLYPLIRYWYNRLPNLRDMFRREQIDCLLAQEVKNQEHSEAFYCEYIEYILIEFVIRSGYKDEPDIDDDGRPASRRTTPIHKAARYTKTDFIIPELFKIYDRFDVNYVDESGLTHFHVACMFGCDEVVKKFLELGQDPNCLPQELDSSLVDPPVCLVLKYKNFHMFKWLLESGADPNLTDIDGLTPLHIICQMDFNCLDHLTIPLFEISNANGYQVQIDVQDKLGNTPSHFALDNSNNGVFELLLEIGVNPNLVNNDGSTLLHVICRKDKYTVDDLVKTFLEINDANHQNVSLDVADKMGRTPLHLALAHDHKKLAELLIRRGANSNLADAEGLTPLHLICKQDDLAGFLTKFFEINDEVKQLVQVNVEDKKGRTPLQWAVARLQADVIEVLLNRGSDFSSFVFPTESNFDEVIKSLSNKWKYLENLVSSTLDIVERLEKKGYELNRSDAITIIKLFTEHGEFKNSRDFRRTLLKRKRFESEAKRVMMNSSLTLYDFIRLQSEEATKLFTITDCLSFVRSNKIYWLGYNYHSDCNKYLRQIMAREFCRKWALEFFLLLTGYQLPILCCEKIIGHLKVEDFWRVCLAVPDQSN